MTNFVSLHNQTHYSILDSLVSPKDLLKRAKELNQSAVAICDHGSLAAAWESLKASKEIGIKLIIGCECYFLDDAKNKGDNKFRHIILLAKNAIGYKNLLTINKKGFDQGSFIGKRVYSVIDWKLLEEHSEGLICLTACGNGIISQLLMNRQTDEAEKTLLRLKGIFGENLGLEVQPNNMKRGSNIYNDEIDQVFLNKQLYNLGKKHNIRVVAACNTHYLTKEEAKIHDVFLAIGSHQTVYSNFRLRYPVDDFYLKSGDEVKAFFVRNYGEEVAQQFCDNSIYFANLCEEPEWIDPKFSNPSGKELPIFPVKDEPDYNEFLSWLSEQSDQIKSLSEDTQYLRFKCFYVFENKIKSKIYGKEQEYIDRIEKELSVLDFQGFSSYMLIVADYVNWARKNAISVGPGRGSCGGSIVAYLLDIHKADPIKYDLLFERFQNKERKSPPDIDQDISASGREMVIEYVIKKYGRDNVAAISNFNRITPKVYVRDVSRAFELGGDKNAAVNIGNNIADIISNEIAKSNKFDDLINKIPLFSEYCKQFPEITKNKQILGKFRNLSTHAAAIVIGQRPLVGLVPLRMDKEGALSVEYDKDVSEANGLIKMDLLGLSTLDDIDRTISILKSRGINLNINDIDLDAYDEKTYNLISSGDTYGVFQFGTSGGTIDLCKRIKPKSIEDLALITTLARPAARDIRDDFIKTKEGKRQFNLLHPSLNSAFQKTYGFGLFDESILQLGKDVAGWTLNESDRIRKMIKEKGKNPEKEKKLREEFIQGAINNGINEIIAPRIWDEEVAKFASYTFNKSHATMYSFISYITAYLKAHYPIEFLLANLMAEVKSNTPDAKSNIDKIKKEIRQHKVKIVPPELNKAQLIYTLEEDKLITGLNAIKFVGDDAIKDILEKRPFTSFFDFMHRVSSKAVRANSIQALAASGALDSFKLPRKLMFLYASDYRKKLQSWLKRHDPLTEKFEYPFPKEQEWTKPELYALEQHYLGEAFVCKPPVAYGDFFKDDHTLIQQIKKATDRTTIKSIKGIIKDFFEFRIKKEGSKNYGKTMVKATFEDKTGEQCSLTIFPDQWEKLHKRMKDINKKAKFEIGLAIHFSGTTNSYEDNMGVIMYDLFNISLPPSLPTDLKAKKILMKELKNKDKAEMEEQEMLKFNSPQDLQEHLEEMLYDEGLLEIEED